MTIQSYNKRLSKESFEKYKTVYSHLALIRNAPKGAEGPAGRVAYSNLLNTHFPTRNKPKTALQPDDWLEIYLKEYTTWFAQTEKRLDKLRYPAIADVFRPTDWSPLQDKEATPDYDC
jgi:hypothetical protein